MPLTARNSARRRRRKSPDEKLPLRREESTSSAAAQVMEPTRMKLRVRRRDNASADATAAANQADEEERSRESGRRGSRRKAGGATSTAANASSWSPPPPPSSASARAAMAVAEEASPDSKCPICLDRFNNLAYLDRCLHRFCFPCIQEWSHNKAECPLCKQPFASILHSVRAEDDFKEYTLRPPPANSSVAATVAMVAAMASAARSDHQMRLMLRRHQGADGEEAATTAAARRRQRGRRSGVWEWYLDTPPLALPPLARHPNASPLVAEDSEEGEELGERRASAGSELAERGVIFEGLTGLSGAEAPVAPNDRAARRLMTRLMARRRLQREGGAVRRLRERETVALRRALYRSGIRVRGVAGADGNQGKQREITAESFLRNPTHLNRLRPWLRRELTVLYGTHGTLVDIVQRIIMARVARHGLEDTPTIEEELRQFLLARTDHFLHELVSFARSPLSLESYDLQAAYEPPDAAMELDGTSSSSDGSSVIAISEGEEEAGPAGGRSDEPPVGGAYDNDDVVPSGGGLSLSVWDDETPGPSYSSAEPSCSLFGHAPQEATNEERGGREEGAGGEEEECLIVGFKKPIAERTPELVQLSSDTDEEGKKEKKEKKEETEELPPLPASTLCYLPTIPPSTSGSYGGEQEEGGPRARSLSCGSAGSGSSVLAVGPAAPGDGRQGGEEAKDRRKRRRRKRIGRKRSGTLHNPNRSLYPAMLRHYSRSSSPLHSSGLGSSSPPSPPGSTWDSYPLSQVSPLSSSASSHSHCSSSSSSPFGSSPPPAPAASLSPGERGEKPGGKRKYKSRHLDDKDPTWRPSSREKGVGGGRSRDRQKRSVGERRSREDRSPSVEIVYEGTAPPPARKRRRKGQLGAQPSSSPVIITLDSDSSLDDDSSPISSQRTVDFSDLPPLPGPPPLILDRVSEVEPEGPVALDNISDVDVEGSPLGSDDDAERPIGKRDTSSADVSSKRHSEVLSSDSCLLATILSDLRGMAAPAAGFDPAHLPDASMTPPPPPLERPREDVLPLERAREDVLPLERAREDVLPLECPREDVPHLERLRGEAEDVPLLERRWQDVPPLKRPRGDVPPLLTQASPVRSYVRDTPPPLKHKDDGCPRLSPVDLHSPPAAHIDSNAPHAASPPDCCHLPAAGLLRGGSREEPARPSSPWGGCRDQTHGSGQVAPVDQRPPSGVSGGGGALWDSSPSFASSIDFRNEDPPPAADPHPPLKRDALSPFSGGSVPTAPLGLSPGDLRPRPKPSVDLPPSSAAGPDGGAWPCLNSALNHAASKLRRSQQGADVPPNHRCPPRPRRDSRLPLDGGEGQWDTHTDSAT
ncbi:uncharacterized protein ACO6RY_03029 [Pungitius sinensis]